MERIERKTGSTIVVGVVMVLLGVLWLVGQVGGLIPWLNPAYSWPLIIIGAGGLLLVMGLLLNAPGMAVPACIVGGIGGLLYYQNVTGDWESWAYAWALIPGFVGVGIILMGLLEGRIRGNLAAGLWLILISAILFTIFAAFFGRMSASLAQYWPILLIVMGLAMVFSRLFGGRRVA